MLACASLLVSCATHDTGSQAAGKNVVYVCGCEATCKCGTVSAKAGKCGCGMERKAMRVVKLEGTDALTCPCELSCTCGLDAKDPTKCGCGKPIRKVSLKGTGLYFCNCGGGCCPTISDQAGQCKCGKALVRAD
jgi:hypothetical protein